MRPPTHRLPRSVSRPAVCEFYIHYTLCRNTPEPVFLLKRAAVAMLALGGFGNSSNAGFRMPPHHLRDKPRAGAGHDAVPPLPYGHPAAVWFRSGSPCQRIPARPMVVMVCVDFYYEFSRQRADVLIYFFPSEITNAEHLPSGHLIEPTAA